MGNTVQGGGSVQAMSQTETLTSLPMPLKSSHAAAASCALETDRTMTASNAVEPHGADDKEQDKALKCAPVSGLPESSPIQNENLAVKANENDIFMADISASPGKPSKVTVEKGLNINRDSKGKTPTVKISTATTMSVPEQGAGKEPTAEQRPNKSSRQGSSKRSPVRRKNSQKVSPAEDMNGQGLSRAVKKLMPFNSPPPQGKSGKRRQKNETPIDKKNALESKQSSTNSDCPKKSKNADGESTRKRKRKSWGKAAKEEQEPRKKNPMRRASNLMTLEPESSTGGVKAQIIKSPTRKGRPKKGGRRKRTTERKLISLPRTPPAGIYHAQSRFGTFSPELDGFEEERQLRVRRAIKRGSTPDPSSRGYDAWKEWKSLRRPKFAAVQLVPRDTTTSLPGLFSLKVDHNLQTFYHILRTQLARGKIWEAIQSCHNMLKWAYQKAETLLTPIATGMHLAFATDLQARELRDEVAGYWCLYAHLFIQISETDAFLNGIDSPVDKPTRGTAALSSMEESLWDQAIAILASSTVCPFVGNHAAITLTLARLRLRQRQRGLLRPFRTASQDALKHLETKAKGTAEYYERSVSTTAHWLKNIRSAMEICRGGIERASPASACASQAPTAQKVSCNALFGEDVYLDAKTTTESVATIISGVVSAGRGNRENSEGTVYPDAVCLASWFLNVMNLPVKLHDVLRQLMPNNDASSEIPYLFVDRPSVRLIFMETNCISRLQQTVETYAPEAKLQLVCDPDRLASDTEKLCVDGVMWDDCLFFQNMNGVIVDEATARECRQLRQQNVSCTADFFTSGGSDAVNGYEDEVDGFAAFPSDALYEDASYPCPKCYCLLGNRADMVFHVDRCKTRRMGQDTLHAVWEDLSLRKSVVSAAHTPGDSKLYFDLECTCRECSVHTQLYAEVARSEQEDCWGERTEENSGGTASGTETHPISLDDSDGDDNARKEAAVATDGPTSKPPVDETTKEEPLPRYKSSGPTISVPSDDEKAVANLETQNRESRQPGTRKRKKPSPKEVLAGAFEVEALGGDENKESDDDSIELVGVQATVEEAVPVVPPTCTVDLNRSKPTTRKSDNFAEVYYPCQKCQQDMFSSQQERDVHESSCNGLSGSSNGLKLEEQWPSFPTKHTNPAKNCTAAFANSATKPTCEGPTPKRPRAHIGRVNGKKDVRSGKPNNLRRSSRGQTSDAGRPSRNVSTRLSQEKSTLFVN